MEGMRVDYQLTGYSVRGVICMIIAPWDHTRAFPIIVIFHDTKLGEVKNGIYNKQGQSRAER